MNSSLYLPIHLFLAVFGYGALFAAFTMGVLYLFQEREILSRSPGRFYYLIPSLARADTIGSRAVLGGFGFLTLAMSVRRMLIPGAGHFEIASPLSSNVAADQGGHPFAPRREAAVIAAPDAEIAYVTVTRRARSD